MPLKTSRNISPKNRHFFWSPMGRSDHPLQTLHCAFLFGPPCHTLLRIFGLVQIGNDFSHSAYLILGVVQHGGPPNFLSTFATICPDPSKHRQGWHMCPHRLLHQSVPVAALVHVLARIGFGSDYTSLRFVT